MVALIINAQSHITYKQKHHYHLWVRSAAKQQKTGEKQKPHQMVVVVGSGVVSAVTSRLRPQTSQQRVATRHMLGGIGAIRTTTMAVAKSSKILHATH